MAPLTILLIEDAEDIRELVRFNLQQEGYSVLEAASGEEGLELAHRHIPNLILLDVMLPQKDGCAVCKELSAHVGTKQIPIIMLTARGDEADRVIGFELGALDYVVKPFSIRELMLRIKAIFKRQHTTVVGVTLRNGPLMLEQASHTAFMDNEKLNLTVTEFAILQDLLLHVGVVRSREQILDAAWGNEFDGYARTVDAHVKRLRAKLFEHAELLETVRGIGYRMKSV